MLEFIFIAATFLAVCFVGVMLIKLLTTIATGLRDNILVPILVSPYFWIGTVLITIIWIFF